MPACPWSPPALASPARGVDRSTPTPLPCGAGTGAAPDAVSVPVLRILRVLPVGKVPSKAVRSWMLSCATRAGKLTSLDSTCLPPPPSKMEIHTDGED